MDSHSFDLAQDRFRGNDKKSVLIGVNTCLYGRIFEKTKPIFGEKNQRKLSLERDIWQSIGLCSSKKQSQSKHALSAVEWANFC